MPGNFGLLELFQTTNTESDKMLGQMYEVADLDYGTGTSSVYQIPGRTALSQTMTLVRRVKAAGTINAGACVAWSAYGTSVVACPTSSQAAGVASFYLPGGSVTTGYHFLMIVKGYAYVLNDGGGALSAGNVVVTSAGTAGQVVLQTAAPANTTAAMVQINNRVGVVQATIASTQGTAGRCWVDLSDN